MLPLQEHGWLAGKCIALISASGHGKLHGVDGTGILL